MRFKEFEEKDNLIKRLENVIKDGRVSHAYIFEGPGCIDKRDFAESFVKGMLCPKRSGDGCGACGICSKVAHQNHEDVFYLSKDGSSVKDAAIMSMQDKLKTKPFGERHIAIIEDSDTMTHRAQNRLLKTLEEPPGNSTIILLSENMENLLPTVLSRCVKYRINYFGSNGYDNKMDQAAAIAEMTLNRVPFYRVKKEISNIASSREDAEQLLDALQVVYRNLLLQGTKGISLYREENLIDNIHNVEAARKKMKDGISASFAMKELLLKIGG